MALPEANAVFQPTPSETLNQMLADVRFAGHRRGVVVNVQPGSELHERFTAIANRLSIGFENNRLRLSAVSPLDAAGDDLEALAGVFGVTRRGAVGAVGFVQVGVTGAPVGIPAGFGCTAADGNQYKTISSVVVANNDFVEVAAVASGANTNQAAGSVVQWDSGSIGTLAQTAVVGAGAIDGGSDEDTDQTLRQRLIRRLSFPASGGNSAQIATLAEEATSAVEVAYVYEAVRGPGSYDVAITAKGGDRTLSLSTVNLVAGAILAEMPGSADLNATSVLGQSVDVILEMALPLPVNSGGAGGGWLDAVPWPSTSEVGSNVYAEITSVDTVNNTVTVNSGAADPPLAGHHFGIWNPTGGSDGAGSMDEFVVLSVAGSAGAWVITIDSQQSASLGSVVAGMFCSAGATNLSQYAEAFRDAVLLLGPGQKTASVDILPRGLRKPGGDFQTPAELTKVLLRTITDSNAEVLDLDYSARIVAGTGAAGTGTFTARTAPDVPPTAADEPRILVLNNLSIRRLVQ